MIDDEPRSPIVARERERKQKLDSLMKKIVSEPLKAELISPPNMERICMRVYMYI